MPSVRISAAPMKATSKRSSIAWDYQLVAWDHLRGESGRGSAQAARSDQPETLSGHPLWRALRFAECPRVGGLCSIDCVSRRSEERRVGKECRARGAG